MGAPAMQAIGNVTLSSASATIVFNNISQSYRDLRLVVTVIGGSNFNQSLRFNSDTGTNYNRVSMAGNDIGSAVSSSNTSVDQLYGGVAGSQPASNIYDILDYSATDKHKSTLCRTNVMDSSFMYVQATAGRWASTSAITSITVMGGTFGIGSSFTLFGVLA